jgi:hypothetical protein
VNTTAFNTRFIPYPKIPRRPRIVPGRGAQRGFR